MDFEKKMKTRLYVAVIYIALGVLMITGASVTKADNGFISSLGFAVVVMGAVRVRNYFMITANEETMRKQEIAETDERNIMIVNKARSATFSIYLLLSGTVTIILSLFEMHDAAKWIAYSVLVLVFIYWICYWVYRKKL